MLIVRAWPLRIATATVVCMLLMTQTTPAQCDPVETHNLVPSDGSEGIRFGQAISVFGRVAAVSTLRDSQGASAGAVYLFNPQSGEQLSRIVPIGRTGEDGFGSAVSLSGDLLLVGAHGDSDVGFQSGAAYLFDARNPRSPRQLAKLYPHNNSAGDAFGRAVALSGSTAIIGAPYDDDRGAGAGSVYAFDVTDAQNPRLIRELLPLNATGDSFGAAVALDGSIAVVGAPHDDDAGETSGSVSIFDVTTGERLAKIVAPDATPQDQFGTAVAISGSIVVVGCERDDERGEDSGSVYVFEISNPRSPQMRFKIVPEDGEAGDSFGSSVSASGDLVVIGAPFRDESGDGAGCAYIYDAETGLLIDKMLASDAEVGDELARATAIYGDTVLAGARGNDDLGSSSGSAYVFDLGCSPLLEVDGECPGAMTISGRRITPGAWAPVVLAFGEGGVRIPPGIPCAGVRLGLDASARMVRLGRADGAGSITFEARFDAQQCGRIYLQVIDLGDCITSNVLRVE